MASAKDEISDKVAAKAPSEVVGESSGTGEDVLVVDGKTRLSIADKDLIVTSEDQPPPRGLARSPWAHMRFANPGNRAEQEAPDVRTLPSRYVPRTTSPFAVYSTSAGRSPAPLLPAAR